MSHEAPTTNIVQWERKRRITCTIFCFITAVIGIETGIIVPTLYQYLSKEIKSAHSDIWYGVINFSYWCSSILGSLTITKYTDKTRNIRGTLIAVCSLVALGNFVYMIPFSPVFPLIGRSIQGFGDSLISVLTGEIARVFPDKDVVKKLSFFITMYYIMLILAPCLVYFFHSVHFHVFEIPVGQYNFPNMFAGLLWLICLFSTLFFVSNLSQEYDLKSTQGEKKNEEQNGRNEKQISLKSLLKNNVYRLLLVLSAMCAYVSATHLPIAFPIIATHLMHLSPSFIALVYSTGGVSFGLAMYFMSKINFFKTEIYFIIAGFCTFIVGLQFLYFAIFLQSATTASIVSLFCFSAVIGVAWSVEQVLVPALLTQLIPSSTQSYAEGVRRAVTSISNAIAGVVGALITSFLNIHIVVSSILMFVMIYFLLVHRKRYCDVKTMAN